jgi:uncharacterized protein
MNKRPPHSERKFISKAVEQRIAEVKSSIKDTELVQLFENCCPNTLDTTVRFSIKDGRPDTFVITGDIDAMWLRDSSAQVFPYLDLVCEEDELKELIKGVINRQVHCILMDPYANAFNEFPGESKWKDDLTEMKPELHERKWELDSLCWHIRLSHNFWKISKDISCFDEKWKESVRLILKTFREQQRKENNGPYKFGRVTSWSTDTVPGNGYGNPVKPDGLIATIFRPSDDAAVFPFNIPANLFAAESLRQLAEMYRDIFHDEDSASELSKLAKEINEAVSNYGTAEKNGYGKVYAYEVDGFGNQLFMDDANLPSLLSLPYLGCCAKDDEIYLNTKKFILSDNNPYFFKGDSAEGTGSPHTLVNNIWPLSIITRAITSIDAKEIEFCLDMLKRTHAGTWMMHESFNKNNPAEYTRDWFAWANSMFGEMILNIYNLRRV